MCGKDINNIELDSDVSLEIPSGTVLAYSVLELEIKKNGHYGEGVNVGLCVARKVETRKEINGLKTLLCFRFLS